MSLVSKALIGAATVFVTNEVRRYAGTINMEDVLKPLGFQRPRSHLGESLVFMGVGVVLGGAAAMVLASTTRADIAEWLSKGAKETFADAKVSVSDVKEAVGDTKEAVGDVTAIRSNDSPDQNDLGQDSSVNRNGQPLGPLAI